jgi:hypothetical protein
MEVGVSLVIRLLAKVTIFLFSFASTLWVLLAVSVRQKNIYASYARGLAYLRHQMTTVNYWLPKAHLSQLDFLLMPRYKSINFYILAQNDYLPLDAVFTEPAVTITRFSGLIKS